MSIKLMSRVWDLEIPATQKLVLLALADNSTDEGYCYPKIQTLMSKCGLSKRGVMGVLCTLKKSNFLSSANNSRSKKDQRTHGRTSNEYWITLPNLTYQVQEVHLPGARGAPAPPSTLTIEPSYEPNTAHALTHDAVSKFSVKSSFDQFWNEYPKVNGRKPDKALAEQKFRSKVPDQETFDKIMTALKTQKRYKQKAAEFDLFEPQFKYAKSWLNQESWNDELPNLYDRQGEEIKSSQGSYDIPKSYCQIGGCSKKSHIFYGERDLCVTHYQEVKNR